MKIRLPLTLRTALLSALLLTNPFPKAEAGYLNGVYLEDSVWTSPIIGNTILDSWYRIDISNTSFGGVYADYLKISNSGEIIFDNMISNWAGTEVAFTNNYGDITFSNSVNCFIVSSSFNMDCRGINFTNNQGNITFFGHSQGVIFLADSLNGPSGDLNFTKNLGDISFLGNSIIASDHSPEERDYGVSGAIRSQSGNISFTKNQGNIIFSTNSVIKGATYHFNGGAIRSLSGNISFTENQGNITFSENSVLVDGLDYQGIIVTSSGSINFSDNLGNITFTNNKGNVIYTTCDGNMGFARNQGDIIFSGNTGTGIVIRGRGEIYFTDNKGHITFSENQGGALNGDTTFTGNQGNITFSGNSATTFGSTFGGAISGKTTFSDNKGDIAFSGNLGGVIGSDDATFADNKGDIIFSGNLGGAIFGYGTTFTGNQGNITFSGNSATTSSDYITFTGNQGNITFAGNSPTTSGRAIFGYITFTGNECNITFSGNSVKDLGGAIYGDTTFTGNQGSITFAGNSTTTSGGAINGQITFTGNQGSIIFSDNSAKDLGGAIYGGNSRGYSTSISIANNETVEFRRNYVKQYDEEGILTGAVLNSITFEGANTRTLELATGSDGGTITFYDPVKVSKSSLVSFPSLNLYEDSEGNSVTGTGAIVFSGLHAEDDLKGIFQTLGLDTSDEAFQSCLTESLTSSITGEGDFTLQGGSLNVTDGAILNILKKKNFNFNYLAKAGSITELFNNGVLNIKGSATFECDGNSYAYLNISSGGAMKASGDFTSSGYTKIDEGTLDIGGNTVLKDGGRIEFQSGSSLTTGDKFTVREGSSVEFTGSDSKLTAHEIVFEQGSYLDHYRGTGSILKAQSVTMTGAELWFTPQSDGYALTVDANLSLTNSTIWLSPENLDSASFIYGSNGIDVTGTLAVSGSTTINLSSEYENWEGSLTLYRLSGETDGSNFTGSISDWMLQTWTETYDAGTQTWIDTFNPLKNAELTTTILSGGKWGVILKLEGGSTPTPGEDDIYIHTGEEKSITDLSKHIHLQGGTLDATGIPRNTPLTNQIVEGTDGLLVMNGDQSLILTGNLTGKKGIGYDIDGTDGNSAGGVAIGSSNGSLNSSTVDLSGERYNIASLNVRSGLVSIKETASLGHENTVITVGSSRNSGKTNTSLINDGSIQGSFLTVNSNGSVTNNKTLNVANIDLNSQSALANTGDLTAEQITVAKDALLNNSGSLEGNVTLLGKMSNSGQTTGLVLVQNGGCLSGNGVFTSVTVSEGGSLATGNGGNPGAPVYTNLTLEDGSSLTFSVDGGTPATNGRSGTYSQATVTTLTINGAPIVGVNIGTGVITSETDSFTLTLLNAENVAGDGAFTTDAFTLTGDTALLEEGSTLLWDPVSGTLSFTGKVNAGHASLQAGNDASLIADTLWSSVSSVVSFARTAVSQSRLSGNGSSRHWVSGLGYFTSMSSANTFSGFSYKGGGYAVGSDFTPGSNFTVGAAFGQMFGTHKSNDNLLSDKQRALMLAFYGNCRKELGCENTLDVSGYFTYGSVDHTAGTHVGGSLQTPGRARWDDNVYTFGILADWNIRVSNTLSVSPFTGITYMYGTQGAIDESFVGGFRRFEEGGMQAWSIPVGVTFKSVCELANGQALLPELSVAYVGDIARRNPTVRTRATGLDATGRGHSPGRNALMVRAGMGWQINKAWTAGTYYTLEVRSGQTNQSVNLNVTYNF